MRQRRWLELIKDYGCTISYFPRKANVVADALSRKLVGASVSEIVVQHQIMMDLERLRVEMVDRDPMVRSKLQTDFNVSEDGVLIFHTRLCVSGDAEINRTIPEEAHRSLYTVKVEHQRLAGPLQPLNIPKWKCERISMDFVTRLPAEVHKQNVIWVMVDWLMKTVHFVPIRASYSMNKLTELYMQQIVRLHGILIFIISD
ncbi:uncharacterized protein LOC131143962 [Malania oleifera]|uniref:uncharacterized protein LOC131143962 n=1 Tax=Malania oleifera TaxID=397392 RepID=UPI0025AE5FC9|nr:uncharacterized protein LOC131143962 [Malania oleifera]